MLTIRPMTTGDDFAAAAQVYVDSWRHAYMGLVPQRYLDKLSPQSWMSVLRAAPDSHLIALADGRTIGTAYITYARDDDRQDYGEIVGLYLLPGETRKGYGTRLWQACRETCMAQGLSGLCLWVMVGNAGACRFYEKMGMQPSGRTKTEAIGGAMLPLMEYILAL